MAGEMRQEWTWRDIFRSIGLAFSFSRLLVGLLGLAIMAVADGLLAWGGHEIVSRNAGNAWLVWLGVEVFWHLRVIILGYFLLGTAVAIAYGVKGELLDGEGAGAKESIGFALKKIGTIFWTPVIFWIYILLMAFFGIVWFLLGRIPVAGPSIAAAGWFFVFLFSVLAGMGFLAFAFSFFLAPSIIAVRQEGALDAVLDTIDLMRGKGAFWVSLLVLVASMLLGPVFLAKTFDVTYKVGDLTMGENFTKTVKCLPKQIQPRQGTFFFWTRTFWPGRYQKPSAAFVTGEWSDLEPNATGMQQRYVVGGWWLGIMILLVTSFAVSFTLGAFVSAATLTYLIVREEEEFLEPISVEPPVPAAAAPEKEKPAKDEKADEKKEEKKPDEKKAEEKAEETAEEKAEEKAEETPDEKKSKRKSKKDSKKQSKKDSTKE